MKDKKTVPDKEEKEKPIPKKCACGSMPISVTKRGGIMLSCPNPVKCPRNLRTRWVKGELTAILEWNCVVSEFKHTAKEERC